MKQLIPLLIFLLGSTDILGQNESFTLGWWTDAESFHGKFSTNHAINTLEKSADNCCLHNIKGKYVNEFLQALDLQLSRLTLARNPEITIHINGHVKPDTTMMIGPFELTSDRIQIADLQNLSQEMLKRIEHFSLQSGRTIEVNLFFHTCNSGNFGSFFAEYLKRAANPELFRINVTTAARSHQPAQGVIMLQTAYRIKGILAQNPAAAELICPGCSLMQSLAKVMKKFSPHHEVSKTHKEAFHGWSNTPSQNSWTQTQLMNGVKLLGKEIPAHMAVEVLNQEFRSAEYKESGYEKFKSVTDLFIAKTPLEIPHLVELSSPHLIPYVLEQGFSKVLSQRLKLSGDKNFPTFLLNFALKNVQSSPYEKGVVEIYEFLEARKGKLTESELSQLKLLKDLIWNTPWQSFIKSCKGLFQRR